jgi:hypothetical protein
MPTLFIEVRSHEETGLVCQHRVDAGHELPACTVLAGKVPANGFVVQRQEKAVYAVRALYLRLFTNTANPFIAASRRISGLAGFAALEPASIYIRAPAEQPTKQRYLFLSSGAIVDYTRRIHRLYDTAHFVSLPQAYSFVRLRRPAITCPSHPPIQRAGGRLDIGSIEQDFENRKAFFRKFT